jgi:hypothetical protein
MVSGRGKGCVCDTTFEKNVHRHEVKNEKNDQ